MIQLQFAIGDFDDTPIAKLEEESIAEDAAERVGAQAPSIGKDSIKFRIEHAEESDDENDDASDVKHHLKITWRDGVFHKIDILLVFEDFLEYVLWSCG